MIKKFFFLILLAGFIPELKAEIKICQKEGCIYTQQYGTYRWFFNGELLEGTYSHRIFAMQDGIYTLEITDSAGIMHLEEIEVRTQSGLIRRIFIIGDSTSSNYPSSVFPQTGWGQVFQSFFDSDSIQIVNKAIPGTSSMSYYNNQENGWGAVLPQLRKGDFLFIQFAHNDEKIDNPVLYTEPFTTYKQYLGNYISQSKAKGVIPVLLTPVNRNTWDSDTNAITNSHGDYPAAMKELAIATKTPILDIGAKSKSLFEKFGKYATTWNIFLHTRPGEYSNYPDGIEDNTHFSKLGASEIAKLVADAIWENTADSLRKLLSPHLLSNTNTNSIKYSINKAKIGYILGPTRVPKNVKCPIKASPATDYLFVNWTVNGTSFSKNAEIIINGNSSYNLVANFIKKGTNTYNENIVNKQDEITLTCANDQQLLKIECSEKVMNVKLFNLKGSCILNLIPKSSDITIHIANFSPGIYLLDIKTSKRRVVKKICL